jgi:hypothetical protein
MKKYTLIIIVIVILIITGIVWAASASRSTQPAPTPAPTNEQGKLYTGPEGIAFSGTIRGYTTDCFADGICSIDVDGKKVIVLAGFRMDPPPVGKLIGVDSIGDLEGKIGWHANVFATTTPEGDYTLYGSDKFYVEVVKIEQE